MAEPLFPPEEFSRRWSALQAGMVAAGEDALLLTGAADIFYLTGFLTRFWESPARPWFVVLPAKGAPVAVIPRIGASLMAETCVGDIRTWDAPDPADDGVSLLAATLGDIVPEGGAIGLPMGLETHIRMPLADFERLRSALAGRRFVDATETVGRVREVKSEAEIAAIRTTCGIADRAFARVPGIAARAGGLGGIFRAFQIALLEEGADWVSYTAGGAGTGGYGNVISSPLGGTLARGDVLMLDTGAVKRGYFCDFDRNFAIGEAEAETERAHATLWQATERALEALRPGQTAADAHGILTGAIVKAGYAPPPGRLGHGLGLTLTEWPSFTDRDVTTLRDGMVLTIEPSLEIAPGRMLVHEENVVLRETGPELLSARAPERLPVIET